MLDKWSPDPFVKLLSVVVVGIWLYLLGRLVWEIWMAVYGL